VPLVDTVRYTLVALPAMLCSLIVSITIASISQNVNQKMPKKYLTK
jgi:hypothetical protein